jgi:hypothetical protein
MEARSHKPMGIAFRYLASIYFDMLCWGLWNMARYGLLASFDTASKHKSNSKPSGGSEPGGFFVEAQ